MLASLCLHAALLWLVPAARDTAPAAVQVLTATLFTRPEIPRPAAPEPVIPAHRPQPLPKAAEPPVPQPSVQPTPAAVAPAVVPSSPVLALAPEKQPAAASVSEPATVQRPRVPDVPTTSPPVAMAPARAAPSQDAGNVDQYRLALMGEARKYKRYPVQAMERGWTGKVEVRLMIGADGVVGSMLVKSSSGFDILDNQALDMIRKAKSLTPIPAALRGREFTIDIPVIFDLHTG